MRSGTGTKRTIQQGDSDLLHHAQRVKELLNETIEYSRSHIAGIDDPKAQALFETTAEALAGLRKAYEDFELKNEQAWRED